MKEAKCPGLDLPLQLLSGFRRGRCSGGAPGLRPLRTREEILKMPMEDLARVRS